MKFASFRTVSALILREMSTRYGRSPGGYLWALIEPLGAIFILSIGFSLLLRSPPLGTSFILFFATGFMPFNLYMQVSGMVSRAIAFSKPLLHYPAVTWVDAILARFILNSLTAVLATYILLSSILAVINSRVLLDFAPMVESMSLAMLLGLSVGTLNCALNGLIPVWASIWSIIMRPLFLASGIILLYEGLPQLAQKILWYNPLIHITGLMRRGFYPTYTGSYIDITYVVLVSVVLLALGLLLLGRYHRDFLQD